MNYQEFLETKAISIPIAGFQIAESELNPKLFPFQKKIVNWALNKGKGALFVDTGLGKTPMQLEFAKQIITHTKQDILIVAPLAVSVQTKREGKKFGIDVNIARTKNDLKAGINITNYERLQHFNSESFVGLILDESSILKGYDGKFRRDITQFASQIPYRLACTATPAPNDLIEIINHAEFLGIMTEKEIKALFFTFDGNTVHKFRLKGHAKKEFWKWLASWAVAVRKPSDIGFSDKEFILPKLNYIEHIIQAEHAPDGYLFPIKAITLQEQRQARREYITEKIEVVKKLLAEKPNESWVIWCDLNTESDSIAKAISDAIDVKGSHDPEYKEKTLIDFLNGDCRILVTKPSIAGHGMNWQHCANQIFFGLSHSFEEFYQAVRRLWRFGQTREVNTHIITTDVEGAVKENLQRKQREAEHMMQKMVEHMADIQLDRIIKQTATYREDAKSGKDWKLMLGDSIELTDTIEPESVGLTLFSPPFPGMYVYSNTNKDVGNTKNINEMIEHFSFLIPKLLRVTMPGRHCCIHLTQAVAFKGKDGYIGIKDFRGKIITAMEAAGWIYYGEVCIDKDPQIKAIRTKDRGLLFKTLATNSEHMHMALADYLLDFRKLGDSPIPIRSGISEKYKNQSGWITSEEWIEWAAPVWYRQTKDYPGGIRETDVLNVSEARENDDERHLCPLQLGVIERAIKLWSNPTDLVFSPFAGIGSEGFKAIELNRRFVGIELKESYWKTAVDNLKHAEKRNNGLFVA